MNGRWRRALGLALPLIAWTAVSACAPQRVDLPETLEVADVASGYHEGFKDERTRLVPQVSFRLRKITPETPLDRVSLSITFRYTDTGDHLDDIYLQRVQLGPEGSEALTVRADTGYTGEPPQTGSDMLANQYFRDLTVRILVRQTAGNWYELHAGPIERRVVR